MIRNSELLLVGASVTIACSSVGWFAFASNAHLDRGQPPALPNQASMQPDQRATIVGEEERAVWPEPEPQSRGTAWQYDLFSPPELFYEAITRTFQVTSAATPDAGNKTRSVIAQTEDLFGLTLRGVEHPLFRLQLIGYFTTDEGELGLFENRVTAEIFLAGSGTVLTQLGIAIETFQAPAPKISFSPELSTLEQSRATVVVRDQLTGQSIILNSTERCFDPSPRATLVADEPAQTAREVSAGDSFIVRHAIYEIEAVRVTPPEVVVVRRASHRGVVERRTLSLSEADQMPDDVPST